MIWGMPSLEQSAKLLFNVSSPLVDRLVKALARNPAVFGLVRTLETRRLPRRSRLRRILVVPGINIGDVVMAQAFMAPFKRFDPDIEISCIYQQKAFPLLRRNPCVHTHFPVFRSLGFPSAEDFKSLAEVVGRDRYDLIINFSPYFSRRAFRNSRAPVITPFRLVANVIRAYVAENQRAQLVFQMNRWAHLILEELSDAAAGSSLSGNTGLPNRIYTPPGLSREASSLLAELGVDPDSKKVLLNPDTSSPYTLIPPRFQVELIKGVVSAGDVTLLLNCGHTFRGIEKELLQELPFSARRKVAVIPKETPIDVYAAVVDRCCVFISGDTAPLHIAAAWKVQPGDEERFLNSTAVIGIFGGTSARIYGYDSFEPKHLPAFQEAPSKVFEAHPPCKNLTCIDKPSKACSKGRCFEGLRVEPVLDYILDYLSRLPERKAPVHPSWERA